MKYCANDIKRLQQLQSSITSINKELSKYYGLDQEKLNKILSACVQIGKYVDLKGFVDGKFNILGVGEVPGRNTVSLPKELSEEVKKVIINYCEKEIDRLNKIVEGKKYAEGNTRLFGNDLTGERKLEQVKPGEYASK
jgi:hypothetical protein